MQNNYIAPERYDPIEPTMAGYYDYVLGAIPGVLVGVTALCRFVGLDLLAAMPVGAAAAALVAGHALFVNGPVTGDDGDVPTRAADGAPTNAD
jgi:hypothetical protein